MFIATFKTKLHTKLRTYSSPVQLVLDQTFHHSCTLLMEAADLHWSSAHCCSCWWDKRGLALKIDCGSGFSTLNPASTSSQISLWNEEEKFESGWSPLRWAACPQELKEKLAREIVPTGPCILFRNMSLKSAWKWEGWVRMGASGLICRSAIKWHARMFDEASRRLCGMAGPSGLPAHRLLHGLAGLLWCLRLGAVLYTLPRSYLQGLHPSQQHPAAIQGLSGAECSCCLARSKNRQLEGIKNNSKKNLFSSQLNAEGGVRRRIKWSVASHMSLPRNTAFGHGDWLYQILNVWPSKRFLQEKIGLKKE